MMLKWEDELARWLNVPGGSGTAAEDVSALCRGTDWTGLSQELPADGGTVGAGDAGPLESQLLVQADRLVGGKDAVLVIDDTTMPKKDDRSVGVAPQYASSLSRTANCQTLVSLACACRSWWHYVSSFPRVGRAIRCV
jgi:DDE superfamily endonuclease